MAMSEKQRGSISGVKGTQTAAPVYRLLDHEASLIATTDSAGSVTGTAVYAPYGQTISSSISDAYSFTGLLQAPEGYHATYRDFAQAPGRWISPDTEIGRTVMRRPQAELIEMNALPTHRHLDDPMYLAQRKGRRNLKAPPNRRTDVRQPDLE
jgi:hypothetical protein